MTLAAWQLESFKFRVRRRGGSHRPARLRQPSESQAVFMRRLRFASAVTGGAVTVTVTQVQVISSSEFVTLRPGAAAALTNRDPLS